MVGPSPEPTTYPQERATYAITSVKLTPVSAGKAPPVFVHHTVRTPLNLTPIARVTKMLQKTRPMGLKQALPSRSVRFARQAVRPVAATDPNKPIQVSASPPWAAPHPPPAQLRAESYCSLAGTRGGHKRPIGYDTQRGSQSARLQRGACSRGRCLRTEKACHQRVASPGQPQTTHAGHTALRGLALARQSLFKRPIARRGGRTAAAASRVQTRLRGSSYNVTHSPPYVSPALAVELHRPAVVPDRHRHRDGRPPQRGRPPLLPHGACSFPFYLALPLPATPAPGVQALS